MFSWISIFFYMHVSYFNWIIFHSLIIPLLTGVRSLCMDQIGHFTFAPPLFDRLSHWNPLGRMIFFLHLLSPFLFLSSLFRVKLKIVDRNETSLSPFFFGSLVAASVVDFRLKPEICSNIRAMEQLGSWELHDSSGFGRFFLFFFDRPTCPQSINQREYETRYRKFLNRYRFW